MLNRVAAEEHQVEIISAVVLQIPRVVAVGRCAVAELMTPYALVGLVFSADILYERDFFARDFDFSQEHADGEYQPAYALRPENKAAAALLYFISVAQSVRVGDKRYVRFFGLGHLRYSSRSRFYFAAQYLCGFERLAALRENFKIAIFVSHFILTQKASSSF